MQSRSALPERNIEADPVEGSAVVHMPVVVVEEGIGCTAVGCIVVVGCTAVVVGCTGRSRVVGVGDIPAAHIACWGPLFDTFV